MNAVRKTSVPLCLAILLASGGCSKSDESSDRAPLVTAAPDIAAKRPAIETQAGGIPTSYTPYFRDEQLVRISEQRTLANGLSALGDYHYHGARLLRYEGTAFEDADPLTLEFSLQGVLTRAHKGTGQAPESEISQARTRAQLLRSHALAQRATKGHGEGVMK